MAISTPAQKPRGSASSTWSTVTQGRLAAGQVSPPVAWVPMSSPTVVAVAPESAAQRAGIAVGDVVLSVNGTVPRDIIEWRYAADDAEVTLEVLRGGLELTIEVDKRAGEPLGAEVSSAVFDRVRTCDNHCEFCFIYQLPKGLRRSLYLKDDDYRLSFLYGNFTTLTRFTEADLERVVTERLSPLNVSIHATDPEVRNRMLKNPRGGMSLRWLRALLDHGITVRGQIVLCPGVNDGVVFERTMAGVLDEYPELESVAVVPLGLSKYNAESAMRLHTVEEARAMELFLRVLGRRMVFAADEYYLMAELPFPEAEQYEGFHMHEDGIGMARTFELEFLGEAAAPTGVQSGFFAWVDGAPAAGYRAPRNPAGDTGLRGPAPAAEVGVQLTARRDAPIGILTGEYGARVITPLVQSLGRSDVRVLPVRNEFFGGNTSVTGLMVGQDIARVLADQPAGHRYLLPDVCLSEGRFLDGTTIESLPRPVEVVPTDGIALRRALGAPILESVS
jgi:putative radical SAM enzyme (TIGR03279 family)